MRVLVKDKQFAVENLHPQDKIYKVCAHTHDFLNSNPPSNPWDVTSWPINLQSCLGSSLCFYLVTTLMILQGPSWYTQRSQLCLAICVCALYLHTQSISNGTSSEEAAWQCSNTMQLQVRPEGLLTVAWSDVLCGVSERPMRKHLQNKGPWKSNSLSVTRSQIQGTMCVT